MFDTSVQPLPNERHIEAFAIVGYDLVVLSYLLAEAIKVFSIYKSLNALSIIERNRRYVVPGSAIQVAPWQHHPIPGILPPKGRLQSLD